MALQGTWKHGVCLHKRSREEEMQTTRNAIIAWRYMGRSTEIEHCNSALLTEEDHNINTTSLENLGILGMEYSFLTVDFQTTWFTHPLRQEGMGIISTSSVGRTWTRMHILFHYLVLFSLLLTFSSPFLRKRPLY